MAKKKWDKFDDEAAREGDAIKRYQPCRRPMGKRILAIRRMHETGSVKIETRIDKRYMK